MQTRVLAQLQDSRQSNKFQLIQDPSLRKGSQQPERQLEQAATQLPEAVAVSTSKVLLKIMVTTLS